MHQETLTCADNTAKCLSRWSDVNQVRQCIRDLGAFRKLNLLSLQPNRAPLPQRKLNLFSVGFSTGIPPSYCHKGQTFTFIQLVALNAPRDISGRASSTRLLTLRSKISTGKRMAAIQHKDTLSHVLNVWRSKLIHVDLSLKMSNVAK